MVGGVVAGSLYLGVDVVGTTVKLLEHTQAMAAAMPSQGASDDPSLSAPAGAAPQSPKESAVAPSAAPRAPAPAAPVSLLSSLASLTQYDRAATETYWKALQECMAHEADRRIAEDHAADGSQLYDYLSARSNGHETAAATIAQLDSRGVDPHVAACGERAQAWHKAGAALYAQAIDLLTGAPSAQLSGPLAQGWQNAATQHHMEERLLTEKFRAVQSYLQHDMP
jgi:hypothetical protein